MILYFISQQKYMRLIHSSVLCFKLKFCSTVVPRVHLENDLNV